MARPEKDPDAPFPYPTQTGFWTGETLRNRLGSGTVPIVDPYDWRKVEFASYLLTIGAEIYVTPFKAEDANNQTKHILKNNESYIIPSGQLALITTVETISVPQDAIAFIAMRSRYKFRGLINVSGFHVDPGYSGKLIFSVYNAGPAPIHITQGEEWFTIFFADMDRRDSALVRKGRSDHKGIGSEQIGAISSHFLTLGGIDEKIDGVEEVIEQRLKTLERDNAVMRWATALIIGFLISFSARTCTTKEDNVAGEAPGASRNSGQEIIR